MPNAQVVWAVGTPLAEVEAYRTFINANSPWSKLNPPQPFAGPVQFDFYNQPYVPYLGPPLIFDRQVIAEPAGARALRTNGIVVHGGVRMPDQPQDTPRTLPSEVVDGVTLELRTWAPRPLTKPR